MITPRAITIHEYVVSIVGQKDQYTGADYALAGVPMMGGCSECHATIAGYNACPTKSGYLVGQCCMPEGEVGPGFATVEEFGAWINDHDQDESESDWVEELEWDDGDQSDIYYDQSDPYDKEYDVP